MFYDRANIQIKAGRGGSGCISFRREKYVPKGGPDGGDGGDGGSIILTATNRLRDLTFFQRKRHFAAESGRPGQGAKKHGRRGEDLVIELPLGTQIMDPQGRLLADLTAEGQQFVAARGGEGGRGNARFVTSTRRAPRFADLGLGGEESELALHLKLLADAGLLGLPNAGKSSLLRKISHAKPKVANYPFTTVAPMLGTVEDAETHQQFTVADIPGLLEGASRGVGLGDDFLKHLERTSLLIHLIDASGYYGQEPLDNFRIINKELADFSPDLARKSQLVALNKVDLVADEVIDEQRRLLIEEVVRRCLSGDPAYAWLLEQAEGDEDEIDAGQAVLLISAATGAGVELLMQRTYGLLKEAWRQQETPLAEPAGHITYRPGVAGHWRVVSEGDQFSVEGDEVERLVARTDFDNDEAIAYLQERLEKLGVSEALRKAGAGEGEEVIIGSMEFELW